MIFLGISIFSVPDEEQRGRQQRSLSTRPTQLTTRPTNGQRSNENEAAAQKLLERKAQARIQKSFRLI